MSRIWRAAVLVLIAPLLLGAQGPVLVAGAPLPSNVNHGAGPAPQALFDRFRSMCISPDGTLFMNDKHNVIGRLTPAGQVTTWAF